MPEIAPGSGTEEIIDAFNQSAVRNDEPDPQTLAGPLRGRLQRRGGDDVETAAYDETPGDGTTDEHAALDTLFNQTLTRGRLTVSPGTHRVASDLEFAATTQKALRILPGAHLAPGSRVVEGQTVPSVVDVRAPLLAGGYRIFDESGGGVVRLHPGSVDHVDPRWFGAVRDDGTGSTAGQTGTALQRALDEATRAGVALEIRCDIAYATTLRLGDDAFIRGVAGRRRVTRPRLIYTGASHGMSPPADRGTPPERNWRWKLQDLVLDCANNGNQGWGVNADTVTELEIDHLTVQGFGTGPVLPEATTPSMTDSGGGIRIYSGPGMLGVAVIHVHRAYVSGCANGFLLDGVENSQVADAQLTQCFTRELRNAGGQATPHAVGYYLGPHAVRCELISCGYKQSADHRISKAIWLDDAYGTRIVAGGGEVNPPPDWTTWELFVSAGCQNYDISGFSAQSKGRVRIESAVGRVDTPQLAERHPRATARPTPLHFLITNPPAGQSALTPIPLAGGAAGNFVEMLSGGYVAGLTVRRLSGSHTAGTLDVFVTHDATTASDPGSAFGVPVAFLNSGYARMSSARPHVDVRSYPLGDSDWRFDVDWDPSASNPADVSYARCGIAAAFKTSSNWNGTAATYLATVWLALDPAEWEV